MSFFHRLKLASPHLQVHAAWSAVGALVAAALLAALPAQALTGQLDTTFGPFGTGWGDTTPQLFNFVALDGLVLPDDRVVVGGACPSHAVSPATGTFFCLAVWPADGDFPTAHHIYQNGAMSRVSSTAPGAIALQRDGKIVMTAPCAVNVGSLNTLCLMRFTSSFAIDTTFAVSSADRVAKTSGTNGAFANAVAIQPDGKIIIAGMCGVGSGYNMCAARFLANGEGDTSFGPGGNNLRIFAGVAATPIDRVKSIAILPSGKILLGGDCRNTNDYTYACAGRLNADGSIDATYNGGSFIPRILPSMGAGDDFINDMKMQANGELLLAGQCNNSNATPTFRVPCVLRVQQDGTFGTPFDGSNNGLSFQGKFLEPNDNGSFRIDRIFLQADGKFLVAMYDYTTVAGEANRTTRIRRYNEDGSIDGNFYEQSIQYEYDTGKTVALGQQSNSKIIMMGTSDLRVRIARLDNRPSAGRGCSMDIDGDGIVSPTTDGLLLARVAAGMTGGAVITGAIGAGGKRNTWPLIRDHLILQCGMTSVKP